MEIIELTAQRLEEFRAYCSAHKYEHDESFLDDDDLRDFEIGDENPTYLLIDDGRIAGVLSLMCTDYFLRGNKSRVRIFHCESGEKEHYKALADRVFPMAEPVRKIEMFLPDSRVESQNIVKSLGFEYYRTAFVMSRRGKEPVTPQFPEGYSLKQFIPGEDEESWAEIRNRAFSTLKGSEVPQTVENVLKLYSDPGRLKGGMVFLLHGEKPVGVIRMDREENDEGLFCFVAPIAIIPEYQGKGLGSELLKAGIAIGMKNGLPDCMLSVNGENENALKLYGKNGFDLDMSVSCFHYDNGTRQTGE